MSWCFACEATLKYVDKSCVIVCPLDWLANRGLTDTCYGTFGVYDSFIRAWNRGDIEAIKINAEVIMNLPLKSYAHNKYDIKETPDD